MTTQQIILLTMLVPFVGALGIALLGRWPNLREALTLSCAGSLLALVVLLASADESLDAPLILATPLPGLSIAFALEPLGLLFALVASGLWIVTSIYSIGYMRAHHELHQTRFYVCFAIAIASVMGLAFSANLLTLFICYEILTLSTYPLVTHAGTEDAKRAGRKYLGILLGTSIALLLLAIVWTYVLAGTLDFTRGGILAGTAQPLVLAIIYALFLFGIGKAALMPFHHWLPAAMVAPTPVSALLHAVAVVKAGVFTVLKVSVYIFGLDTLSASAMAPWFMYVVAFTLVSASLVALTKDNLKARLAYSTISQLAYVVLGATMANSLAMIGAGMHIAMHAFGKITLFLCAGAIMVSAHKTNVSQMRGLGRRMPFTLAAFFIGSLCIIGLPPTGGLWSKWYLGLGAMEAGQPILVAVLMLSSLLNVAYLLPIPIRAFFCEPDADDVSTKIEEAPIPCLIAIAITSVGCIALFFAPTPLYQLMERIISP